ncbi:enoyl-CoA hydratase-related protein [Lacibacter sp. H375]|uniref:enoyl-CoA hydratase/isomerase family protein n=1 Tax=Lacibacter sp. H375 TaxID=3133424 RepID=UPI0030BD7215
MSYQTLLTSLEDGIFVITINRPEKLNALNKTVIEELSAAVDEVYSNAAIKCAVVTGAGLKAFVAGADISEFLSMGTTDGEELARKGQEMVFNKIERSPKPIIAAVNGFALGGGCELAMSCHFRLASENAKFGQPEVNLGLIPGYGGTQRLVQLIGKGKAMELMMTAAMIDASEAKQLGLVNYVVTADELLPNTKELLATIMGKGPTAVAKVIAAVNAHFDSSQNGFDAEIKLFGECFGTEEMKEGVGAFLEKRKAQFGK